MPVVDFQEGDEIVVSRRRYFTVKNPETNEDEEKTELLEISAVRCPQKIKVGGPGGEVVPEYKANDENPQLDRRFLTIRLPMRY